MDSDSLVSEPGHTFRGHPRGPTARPKVTVGLAVYNGERFLDDAIASILEQTFRDFELIICDNASTDATPEICGRHVARDPRVRYFRNPVNIGGVRNENRTMFLARGRYYKLAAHDDRLAPEFLEKCVAILDANPAVEVCMTGVVRIDASGDVVLERAPTAGAEERPHLRVRAITHWGYACEAAYGLIRTSALREVRPQTNHLHSDRVWLSELALRSRFWLVDEPLFFKRVHEDNAYKDWRARMAWFQPELKLTGELRFPHWQQACDYVSMFVRSTPPGRERLRCWMELVLCLWRVRRLLLVDLVDGLRMIIKGKRARRIRYQDEAKWR